MRIINNTIYLAIERENYELLSYKTEVQDTEGDIKGGYLFCTFNYISLIAYATLGSKYFVRSNLKQKLFTSRV